MPGFGWHDAELPDQVVITYPWTPTGLRGNAFGGKSPALAGGEVVHQADGGGCFGDSTTVAVSGGFGDDGIHLVAGVRRFASRDHNFSEAGLPDSVTALTTKSCSG